MATTWRPSRRSVLTAFLAATGAAGSGVASKLGDSETTPADSEAGGGVTVPTLFLDRYSTHTAGRGRGQRTRGDQTVLRGTLTTEDGDRFGEVFASALTMPGPIDADAPQTARMEVQNLQMHDGTILGMGTTFAHVDVPNLYTIIGGSGRYAGVRGGYTFDHNPSVARPDGQATIKFDLVV